MDLFTLYSMTDFLGSLYSRIFGKHTATVTGSRPNSSVAKLAAQRAARELAANELPSGC